MDKIQIRFTREQLNDLIDALGEASVHIGDEDQVRRLHRLGSWLTDRYTRQWGLPRAAAAAAALLGLPGRGAQ